MIHRSVGQSTLVLALALAGCSSSTPQADGHVDAGSAGPDGGPRAIADEVLARQGVAYSGYRRQQGPATLDYPTEAQIKEDLELLVRGGWTFLRLFDSSRHAELVLKVIKDNSLDMKVMLGVWISGGKATKDAQNKDQIEKCVALHATYGDIIAAVSVGNETLDDWSSVRTPVADLVGYIEEVRERVPKPVTTDDMFLPFMFGSVGATSYADVVEVARAVDFLSIHAYAFIEAQYRGWDWQQLGVPEGPERAAAMMKASLGFTQACIRNVRTALASKGLDRPIVLGEAGWKSTNTRLSDRDAVFRAHPVNQKMFYDGLTSWVYGSAKDAISPRTSFYFEAFDEPWKQEDDGWGLFDVDRKAKYVVWNTFPDRKPGDAPGYAETDAVFYKPPPMDAGAGDTGASEAGDAGSEGAADGRAPADAAADSAQNVD